MAANSLAFSDLIFTNNNFDNSQAAPIQNNYHQGILDGFDELWEATEESLPSVKQSETLLLEQKYSEELLYLMDEIKMLRFENIELKQELAEFYNNAQSHSIICSDYSNLIDLNRVLTKQLNQVINIKEKQKSQLDALKRILG
ncbi:MAG: hypothetical protein ACK481_07525 [Candidatus Melainabacteria bacterium]|jgi:hypothetical protein